MNIKKVHGSENDFFLIDETALGRALSADEIESLRLKLCNREKGLLGGADGLLLVEPVSDGDALAKMRVINRDGSEASMCGNGLRTVARHIAEKYDLNNFSVKTMHADLAVSRAQKFAPDIETYQVEISPVSFETDAIPMTTEKKRIIDELIPELSDTLRFSVVAVPNPHLISFVDHQTLWSSEFERIASSVNNRHTLFPDGINVSFVEILDENKIFVRTYERGVGFTNACGTAMCASSLMYTLLKGGHLEELITVRNPGGMVKTKVHKDRDDSYSMRLIGNATITHEIDGELSDFIQGKFSDLMISETIEQEAYLRFIDTLQ